MRFRPRSRSVSNPHLLGLLFKAALVDVKIVLTLAVGSAGQRRVRGDMTAVPVFGDVALSKYSEGVVPSCRLRHSRPDVLLAFLRVRCGLAFSCRPLDLPTWCLTFTLGALAARRYVHAVRTSTHPSSPQASAPGISMVPLKSVTTYVSRRRPVRRLRNRSRPKVRAHTSHTQYPPWHDAARLLMGFAGIPQALHCRVDSPRDLSYRWRLPAVVGAWCAGVQPTHVPTTERFQRRRPLALVRASSTTGAPHPFRKQLRVSSALSSGSSGVEPEARQAPSFPPPCVRSS